MKKNKSNIEKFKGMSFSQVAQKIQKKYPNASTDLTQKAALEKELGDLVKHQTNVRMATQMEESLKQFKNGGELPKYILGTNDLGDPEKQNRQFSTYAMSPLDPLPQINPFKPDLTLNSAQNTNPLIIDNNSGMLTPKDAPRIKKEGSAYTPALIGQGISTALNAGILADGYDKVAPVDNPYESQIKQLMGDRGIDTTQQRNQILSQYNAAKANLGNARSANVQQALGANLMNVTQDSLAQSKLQEQQLNNQSKAAFSP